MLSRIRAIGRAQRFRRERQRFYYYEFQYTYRLLDNPNRVFDSRRDGPIDHDIQSNGYFKSIKILTQNQKQKLIQEKIESLQIYPVKTIDNKPHLVDELSIQLIPNSTDFVQVEESEVRDDLGDLSLVPMFRVMAEYYLPDYDLVNHYDKNQGQCVYDYLEHRYAQTNGFAIVKNREKLAQLMGCHSPDDGVNCQQLSQFCYNRGVTMYALDLQEKVFSSVTAEDLRKREIKRSRAPNLCFIMAGQHMWPISNQRVIKSLARQNGDKSSKTTSLIEEEKEQKKLERVQGEIIVNPPIDERIPAIRKKKIQIPKKTDEMGRTKLYYLEDCTVFMTLNTDLKKLYWHLYEKEGVLYPMFINKDRQIKEIHYKNNVRIYHNPDYFKIRALCDQWHIPFINQTLPSFSLEIEKILYHGKTTSLKANRWLKKIERELGYPLVREYLIATRSYPFSVDGFDLETNTIYEYHGCHWHGCPQCEPGYKKRYDRTQDRESFFREKGYKIVSLWECQDNSREKLPPKEPHPHWQDRLNFYQPQVREVMESELNAQYGGFMANLKAPDPEKYPIAIDIRRAHKNFLWDGADGFPLYDITDQIEIWDGVRRTFEGPDLKIGKYYVESDNLFPLWGNGWYSHLVLNYCQDQGIPFTLKYMIRPAKILPSYYFRQLIDTVYDQCEDDIAKLLINFYVGLLKGKPRERVKVLNTTSPMERDIYYWRDPEHNYPMPTQQFPNRPDVYQIRTHLGENINLENSHSIYDQIYEMTNIELHKLVRHLKTRGGTILRLKKDCAVAEFDQPQTLESLQLSPDKYKEEKIPMIKEEPEKFWAKKRTETFSFTPSDVLRTFRCQITYDAQPWPNTIRQEKDMDIVSLLRDLVESGQSVRLQGFAGYGKSYYLNQIMEEYGDKALSMAFTNKASRHLINAETIHHTLGIDFHTKTVQPNCLKRLERYKVIIVDELSLIPDYLWRILVAIKQICPQVSLIISGDLNQLRGVDETRYRTSPFSPDPFLPWLCDGNLIELTINRRSDKSIDQLCQRILKGENVLPYLPTTRRIEGWSHICWTNKKRNRINRHCMSQWLNLYPNSMTITVLRKNMVEHSEKWTLAEGMPIICIKSNKKMDIQNAILYRVKELDPENKKIVLVEKENPDKEVTLGAEIFGTFFTLGFCLTCHKCQGDTLTEPTTIWDWNAPKINEWGQDENKRWQYTALSRLTTIDLLKIGI